MFKNPQTTEIYDSLCQHGYREYVHQFMDMEEEDWRERLGPDYGKISPDALFVEHMMNCINTDLSIRANLSQIMGDSQVSIEEAQLAQNLLTTLTTYKQELAQQAKPQARRKGWV